MRSASLVLAAWMFLAALPAEAAWRITFRNGKTIEADRAWKEGQLVVYERGGKTLAIHQDHIASMQDLAAPGPASRPAGASSAPRSVAGPTAGDSSLRYLEGLVRANALLEAGRGREAAEAFSALIGLAPEALEPRLGYARALVASGSLPQALRVLGDLKAERPTEPRVREALGDALYEGDRLPEAIREWQAAVSLGGGAGLAEKIAKAEREARFGRSGELTAESAHFQLSCEGDAEARLVRKILDGLEAEYRDFTVRFRHVPAGKLSVILYSGEGFHGATATGRNVGGLYDGKVRVPVADLGSAASTLPSVLRHELTHAFVHSIGGEDVPRWLHEGLAEHMEGANPGAEELVLAREWNETRGEGWTFRFSYPAANSLVGYLVRAHGFDTLVQALERMGKGAPAADAIDRAYGGGFEELVRDWGRDLAARAGMVH